MPHTVRQYTHPPPRPQPAILNLFSLYSAIQEGLEQNLTPKIKVIQRPVRLLYLPNRMPTVKPHPPTLNLGLGNPALFVDFVRAHPERYQYGSGELRFSDPHVYEFEAPRR